MILRPLLLADVDEFTSWADDDEFCRVAGWSAGGDVRGFWTEVVTNPPAALTRLAAVEGGETVGYVDLFGDQPDERELGYVIGPSARWSRGLGRAAAAAGVAHAFGPMRLTAIRAEATNEPSARILRALGMSESDPWCFRLTRHSHDRRRLP
jgi:RimJ/RimL family protein N-acetyltransferase